MHVPGDVSTTPDARAHRSLDGRRAPCAPRCADDLTSVGDSGGAKTSVRSSGRRSGSGAGLLQRSSLRSDGPLSSLNSRSLLGSTSPRRQVSSSSTCASGERSPGCGRHSPGLCRRRSVASTNWRHCYASTTDSRLPCAAPAPWWASGEFLGAPVSMHDPDGNLIAG